MSEWISIEEREPLLYQSVLVKTEKGEIIIASLGGDETRFYETRHDTLPYLKGVTHWQPLPPV